MAKLTAADVARLQSLGDGWEDSEAPVTINAADAAALGFDLDGPTDDETAKAKAKGRAPAPKLHATVKGNDLFLATRNLQVGDDVPEGAEPTPNQRSLAGLKGGRKGKAEGDDSPAEGTDPKAKAKK